jgi:DNA-binding NarL/FixJ family response regulator
MKITVAIEVDADEALHQKLSQLFLKDQSFDVLEPRTTSPRMRESLVDRITRLKPNILLAKQDNNRSAGNELLAILHEACPETKLILLTSSDELHDDEAMNELASGVRGYLNVNAAPDQISHAVQVINNGEAWVSRMMMGKVMDQVTQLKMNISSALASV